MAHLLLHGGEFLFQVYVVVVDVLGHPGVLVEMRFLVVDAASKFSVHFGIMQILLHRICRYPRVPLRIFQLTRDGVLRLDLFQWHLHVDCVSAHLHSHGRLEFDFEIRFATSALTLHSCILLL